MNNMGSMNLLQIMAFSSLVLMDFVGWQVRWTKCSTGLCLRKKKVILIPERMIGKYTLEAKEYILHEAAHISTPNDHCHGVEFYKEYIRLLTRHMLD